MDDNANGHRPVEDGGDRPAPIRDPSSCSGDTCADIARCGASGGSRGGSGHASHAGADIEEDGSVDDGQPGCSVSAPIEGGRPGLEGPQKTAFLECYCLS